ncbi:hypothetical protein GGI24_004411 [Coemansia furcata]|nr:hypothetical protein GGI24_004411 [Coemansia furcata]
MIPVPDYVGNAAATLLVPCDTRDVLSLPVIDLARLVKEHVRQLRPGRGAHYINEAFNRDGRFFIKSAYLCTRAESRMVVSNLSRVEFFDTSFGHGKPIALLCGVNPVEGMMIWMPSADGGIDIHYGLKDGFYNVLRRDPVLNKFVEFAN